MKKWWNEVTKFNDQYFPGWRLDKDLIFFSNALAGEVGELCGLVKRFYGGGTNNRTIPLPSEMVEEAVDVFIYLVLFCEALTCDEHDFDEIFAMKIRKLKRRMENE